MKINYDTKYGIGDIVYKRGERNNEYIECIIDEIQYVESINIYITYSVRILRTITIAKKDRLPGRLVEAELYPSIEELMRQREEEAND